MSEKLISILLVLLTGGDVDLPRTTIWLSIHRRLSAKAGHNSNTIDPGSASDVKASDNFTSTSV